MSKTNVVRITIPSKPKNEDAFCAYQKAYVKYLRAANNAKRNGKNVSPSLMRDINKRWMRAGILNKNGSISKKYSKVITND